MARILFFFSAILWFAYGIYIYYDMAIANNNKSSADVVTLFAIVNAGLFLFSGIKFGGTQKWFYYFALTVTALNLLLSLFNIIDLYFLISFIIDLLILWAIFPLRNNYFLNS